MLFDNLELSITGMMDKLKPRHAAHATTSVQSVPGGQKWGVLDRMGTHNVWDEDDMGSRFVVDMPVPVAVLLVQTPTGAAKSQDQGG